MNSQQDDHKRMSMTPEMADVKVLATMTGPWPGNSVEVVESRNSGLFRFVSEGLRRGRRADAVILLGSCGFRRKYAEQILAILLRFLRSRAVVVLHDATWDVGSESLARKAPLIAKALPMVARAAVKLMDSDRVHYCVLSTGEAKEFPSRWGVGVARVHFVPFCATIGAEAAANAEAAAGDAANVAATEAAATVPTTGHLSEQLNAKEVIKGVGELSSYVFAGGSSYRDFDLLLEAVKGTGIRLVVATSRSCPPGLPPNVKWGWLEQKDYNAAMAGAAATVTALRDAPRSAGQATYLNSLRLARPTVVTDSLGVRDHVDESVAIIVKPEVEALRRSILWVLAPQNRVEATQMAERGRELVLSRYLGTHYRKGVWDVTMAALSANESEQAGHS